MFGVKNIDYKESNSYGGCARKTKWQCEVTPQLKMVKVEYGGRIW